MMRIFIFALMSILAVNSGMPHGGAQSADTFTGQGRVGNRIGVAGETGLLGPRQSVATDGDLTIAECVEDGVPKIITRREK
jgi:hypothetical protein